MNMPTPIEALEFRIEQYGWSQNEFAKRIGMLPSHFSEVMNGKRRMSLDAIRNAVALGVPANVLLQPFPCEKVHMVQIFEQVEDELPKS